MAAKIPVSIGQRFGCLTVTGSLPNRYGKPNYQVTSDCGNVTQAIRTFLKEKRTACSNQCPLRPKRAGAAGHAAVGVPRSGSYSSWNAMKQRCYDENCFSYKYYGALGVKLCERWQQFPNFLADMGERPQGKTIDRYPDPNGDYEPTNCRWATAQEQRLSQRPRRTRPW